MYKHENITFANIEMLAKARHVASKFKVSRFPGALLSCGIFGIRVLPDVPSN